MRIIDSCAKCLYDKQRHLTEDGEYLKEVKNMIDSRRENDTAPYLLYLFTEAYRKRFGEAFLLITDNCGEIVLDKLFVEQLVRHFPDLEIRIMVRGEEVLNDATLEDACYVGLDKLAEIISNGNPAAGTVYDMFTDEAKKALDTADVILAKGQGNYESLCKQGRHIFYSFLCKCELFTRRFRVPQFTGIFVEER